MNENVNNLEKKNDNKGLLFSLVGVLTLLVAVVGATYAFFQVSKTASGIEGQAAQTGLDLTVTKEYPATDADTSGNLVPQLASAINEAAALGCVSNKNTICQVYRIDVSNTGQTPVTLKGTISFSGIDQMPNLKYSTSKSISSGYNTTGITASGTPTEVESDLTIQATDSSTIYLVVWVDETNEVQTDSGTFTATVTYNAANDKGVKSTITS